MVDAPVEKSRARTSSLDWISVLVAFALAALVRTGIVGRVPW